ncbi:tetratricopeptide repeat protein 27-like isoform X2 [Clytia hemisphaerica]|uniref:Tetratricopeptide repeat protein 27 n=2 Tax=Clytia hemisphaerica TaxID=252671 RepID=A0A7M5XIA2_9CNID
MTDQNEKQLLLLIDKIPNVKGVSENDMVQKVFVEEQWEVIFSDDRVKELCAVISLDQQPDDLHSTFVDTLTGILKQKESSATTFALLGVACLKLLLQANWTGPEYVEISEANIEFNKLVTSKEMNERSMKYFEANDDDLYSLLKYPVLLFIAKVIFEDVIDQLSSDVLKVWSIKYFATFLKLVEDVKDRHFTVFQNIFDDVQQFVNKSSNISRETKAEIYIDCSHIFLMFYDYRKAQECLDLAGKILGLTASLTSALGKRTRWQQTELPQMKLNIQIDEEREKQIQPSEKLSTGELPSDVILDNDTLLPEIKFVDGSSAKTLELTATDQAYIVANCIQLRRVKPRDALSHEEITPYCDGVLKIPQSWGVQFKALFLRCITEFSNSRKAERALQQLESLSLDYTKETPKGCSRQHLIQAVDLDPMWEHKRHYAQLLYSIGMTDSALEIFLKLHLWDDVISCYQRLGRHGKAEKCIREQLAVRETATLWNLLGDATMDKEYYEKAWEFSKYRNARSQKSLGYFYLRKHEYEQAIPHFEKSLELNSLQPGMAFSLGCACMGIKQLERAIKAFQASVSLDPDMFECWSNLGACFIRTNQMKKAYKALKQASSLSYNNWRVWENFLLVAADIGNFDQMINALRRLVDLDRKTLDREVLQILVDSVLKDEVDMNGANVGRLKKKTQQLFAHITSSITSDPHVWEIYAQLCLSHNTFIENEKALQHLYRSHRCYTQNHDWEQSEECLPDVMRVTMKLIDATNLVCESEEGKNRSLSLYSTTKMSISNLILRLQKAYKDDENNTLDSVQPHIDILQEHLTTLQNILHNMEQ